MKPAINFVALLAVFAVSCSDVPRRPRGVPANARWAGGPDGGHFIRCLDRLSDDYCEVYNDQTGKLIEAKAFVLHSSGRRFNPATQPFLSFDSYSILLRDGDRLDPIAPKTVPAGAALTPVGHQWISCVESEKQTSVCALFSFSGAPEKKAVYVMPPDQQTQVKYVDEGGAIHLQDGHVIIPS